MALPTAICPQAEPPSGSRLLTVHLWAWLSAVPFVFVGPSEDGAKPHSMRGAEPRAHTGIATFDVVGSVEFLHRGGLGMADAAGFNSGAQVVFASNGSSGHAPQHGDLAHMRERVRNRTLEQFFG